MNDNINRIPPKQLIGKHTAVFCTLLVSAVVHEYLLAMGIGFVLPIVTILFAGVGGKLMLWLLIYNYTCIYIYFYAAFFYVLKPLNTRRASNLFFLSSLNLGLAIIIFLLIFEYAARQYCPVEVISSIINLLTCFHFYSLEEHLDNSVNTSNVQVLLCVQLIILTQYYCILHSLQYQHITFFNNSITNHYINNIHRIDHSYCLIVFIVDIIFGLLKLYHHHFLAKKISLRILWYGFKTFIKPWYKCINKAVFLGAKESCIEFHCVDKNHDWHSKV